MANQRNETALLEKAIREIADGDKSALAGFYDLTAEAVMGLSLSILKNRADAEDVISELLLEVWRCAPNYKPQGRPMAWVVTIARRLAFQRLREHSRTAELSPEAICEVAAPEGLSVEDRTLMRVCFESLSEQEREVVAMHAIAGLKHREIAAILDQPLSTVISRYNKSIKKLNKELKGEL